MKLPNQQNDKMENCNFISKVTLDKMLFKIKRIIFLCKVTVLKFLLKSKSTSCRILKEKPTFLH